MKIFDFGLQALLHQPLQVIILYDRLKFIKGVLATN